QPLHDPYDVRGLAPWRHELDHPHGALVCLEYRLEDERVAPIAAAGPSHYHGRRQEPAAVIRLTQQRGKAGTGVEAGEAAPVDGPLSADKRRRLEVADQRIVLDSRHSANPRSLHSCAARTLGRRSTRPSFCPCQPSGGRKGEEMLLENRKAIVTGASSGIGKATAERLCREGASVCVNYYSPEERSAAEGVVTAIEKSGARALAIQADVGNEDDVEQMTAQEVKELPGLDLLVNNSGIEK